MCRIITKTGISVKGKVLVPCEYDEIIPAIVDGEESKEIFLAMKNGMMQIIIINEKDCSYCKTNDLYKYHNVYAFKKGTAIVSRKIENDKYKHGLIDIKLSVELDCKYDGITPISDTLYAINDNGKSGIYDTEKHKFIVPIGFSGIAYNEAEQKITLKL